MAIANLADIVPILREVIRPLRIGCILCISTVPKGGNTILIYPLRDLLKSVNRIAIIVILCRLTLNTEKALIIGHIMALTV